jgi:PIN domain nuclease of toxin-antitoxin system
VILLDTHALIWLDQGSEQLGRRARSVIEAAFRAEDVAIATISFWEVGMWLDQQRLEFEGELQDWRVSLLNSGFTEVAADGRVALAAAALQDFEGDTADRLITATAIAEKARLVTADYYLLSRRGLRTVNALN